MRKNGFLALAEDAPEVPSQQSRGCSSCRNPLLLLSVNLSASTGLVSEGVRDPDCSHGHLLVLCIEESHNIWFSASSLDYFSGLLLSCEHDVQP